MKKGLKDIYLLLFGLLLAGCNSAPSVMDEHTVYFCDAENAVQSENGQMVFSTPEIDFKSAENQSADFAFSGGHSVKLDASSKYGMSFVLTDIQQGEFFKASVWQKESESPGAMICSATGNANFTLTSLDNGFYERKNGWVKHSIQFKAITTLDSLTFFLFVGGDDAVCYFDDLRVERFASRPAEEITGTHLSIQIPDSSTAKLDKYISKAIKEEIIENKYKKYVAASLLVDGEEIPVEMRLKGDWTDHLVSGNASYRIKTASGTAYNGLRSFSIQHPKTRNYLHEWFIHKLCDGEDLLSTRYDFLQVDINGENQGVYALEEHFDKQLLESRNRREGPILKMDETGFWALAVYARENGLNSVPAPYFESSITTCFKESRTLKSPALSKQFRNGAILLKGFKEGTLAPDLIFDIERIATYYALMDLGNIHHSLAWHNRRFYYNPVTAKLEHVGFDMIPMVMPLNPTMATNEFRKDMKDTAPEGNLNYNLFLNDAFRKVYTEKLTLFSSEAYLDSAFAAWDEEIAHFEELLRLELNGYVFEKEMYYQKAALIRNELVGLDTAWDVFMEENKLRKSPVVPEGKYAKPNDDFYVKEISVNGYRKKLDSAHYQIEFENYHCDSVQILGYAIKANKDSLIAFQEPIHLNAYTGGADADYAMVELGQKPSRYFILLPNKSDSLKKKKFYKWEQTKGEHPRVALSKKQLAVKGMRLEGQQVVFAKGRYVVDELVYFPEGYAVTFEAGASFDFINRGGMIINGNADFMGTETDKVHFYSSDSTGQGITILQADSVNVSNTLVEDMNTLNEGGWTLTGAFSVYESEVVINGLTIRGNNCEDGLNIIRSNFDITDLTVEETKSDAFDADFCTGNLTRAIFRNTGNDCIDFSGSVVHISEVDILNSGDKGVSAGERSTLYLNAIRINGALTGLASKDSSVIVGENIVVKNAEVGVAAFQKKPEYGGSVMDLIICGFENLRQYGLVEKGSEVTVDGKTYGGYQKFDIDQMYARFGEK